MRCKDIDERNPLFLVDIVRMPSLVPDYRQSRLQFFASFAPIYCIKIGNSLVFIDICTVLSRRAERGDSAEPRQKLLHPSIFVRSARGQELRTGPTRDDPHGLS